MRISWVPKRSPRPRRGSGVLGAALVLLAAGAAEAGLTPGPLTAALDPDEPVSPAMPSPPAKCPEDAWVCVSLEGELPTGAEATLPRRERPTATTEAQPPFLTTFTQAVVSLDAACRDERPGRMIRLYTWRSAHDEPRASVPIPPAAWSGFACLAALAGFKVLRRRSLRSD